MTHFLAFDQCSESFPHKFFRYDSLKTANIYPDVIVWGLIVERSQHSEYKFEQLSCLYFLQYPVVGSLIIIWLAQFTLVLCTMWKLWIQWQIRSESRSEYSSF